MIKNTWEILNKLYVNKGLRIFPVQENGKTPLIKQWQIDCSSNFMQILYWTEHAKDCNWGMPASENNLFIIDCDVHDPNKNGVENFDRLLNDLCLGGAETLIQQTPSGGLHIIYKSDEDLKNVSNNSNCFVNYEGIDIRTDGYIVVHPSQIDEIEYKFINDLEPQEMPKELKEFILNNAENKVTKKKTPYKKPKEVEKGDRDNQLFQYINQIYFKTDLDFDEVLLLAENFNETILEEPFSDKEVRYKVKKAFEKPKRNRIILVLGDDE